MSLKHMRVSLILAGLMASSSLCFGQTGSIAGKAIGPDGQPLQGALVKIERIDVRGNYKVKTKKKGDYFHAGLPLGRYNVSVEIDGAVQERVSGVRVGMGDPTRVDFDLAKKAAQAKTGPTQADLAAMSPAERKNYEDTLKKRQVQISKNKELNDTFGSGMVALKTKNFPVAVANLSKAAELDPGQHVVWANLGDAQSQLARSKTGADRTKLYDDAIASYNRAIEIDPTSAPYHNNLGLVMVRAGQPEEGKLKLAEAAMLDPVNGAKFYFNLGAVMVNTGNTEGAIDAFRRATDTDPNYAMAYYQLGMALVGMAETKADGSVVPAEGTIEAFEKYVELDPTGDFAQSAQGMVQGLSAQVETSYEDTTKKTRKKRRPRKKSSS